VSVLPDNILIAPDGEIHIGTAQNDTRLAAAFIHKQIAQVVILSRRTIPSGCNQMWYNVEAANFIETVKAWQAPTFASSSPGFEVSG